MKRKNSQIIAVVCLLPFLLLIASPKANAQKKKSAKQATENQLLVTNPTGKGSKLLLSFIPGPAHNHPLMVVWAEDTEGNYLQTLYVAKSIASGVFAYGKQTQGKWEAGEINRPAALPYWSHKRNIVNDLGGYMPRRSTKIADAYSGATPQAAFTLETRTDEISDQPFTVLLEINQPWDWNNYWTNSLYPDDKEYKSSAQPALVYAATIDPKSKGKTTVMQLIGRSSASGSDGNLYKDLETMSTALQIASEITVTVE